jgi:hypothetical protein
VRTAFYEDVVAFLGFLCLPASLRFLRDFFAGAAGAFCTMGASGPPDYCALTSDPTRSKSRRCRRWPALTRSCAIPSSHRSGRSDTLSALCAGERFFFSCIAFQSQHCTQLNSSLFIIQCTVHGLILALVLTSSIN